MDNKYNQMTWRRLMLKTIKTYPEGLFINDFVSYLHLAAKKADLYPSDNDLTEQQKKNIAWTYVIKELLGFERKQGLEGKGYVSFSPEEMPVNKGRWGMEPDEIWDTFAVLMDSLRYSGAMTYPETINPEDDDFAPRNREMFFRELNNEKESRRYISFMPVGKTNNKRIDFIRKYLGVLGIPQDDVDAQSREMLTSIYDNFKSLMGLGYVVSETRQGDGVVYRLNLAKWKIRHINEDSSIYRCKRCGKITVHNVRGVCPEFRCSGSLEMVEAKSVRNDPYYSKIYKEDRIIPMVSKEHTAQLHRDKAGDIQKQFENGVVNVLSCSTTFEMGVDVGQLEAIFLRNVPPETANYVQRAGRAGRRTSSTAFSVTFARRNSHDLNYFSNPSEIISGKIKAPYIELKNEKIAVRHVNSIVMAWFFRMHEDYFNGNALAITGANGMDDAAVILREMLLKKPSDLLDTIQSVLPSYLFERLRIAEWDFVAKIVGESGSLTNAIEMTLADKESLMAIVKDRENEARQKHKMAYIEDIRRHINTIDSCPTIPYLASGGVLPKYGFPVDVVALDVFNNSKEAASVDLTRDLKMAISEYAPGSEVIAGGKIWTSYSINKVKDKEWPTYRYFECPVCKKAVFPEGMTTLDESGDQDETEICSCGKAMKPHKFIIPIFGFSTRIDDKPKRVGEQRPKRFYSTKVQFAGFEKLDIIQEKEQVFTEISIGKRDIRSMYSPQGKLILLNKGAGRGGFFVCQTCGFASSLPQNFQKHHNRLGKPCSNSTYRNTSLGHVFHSDILKLEFPSFGFPQQESGELWISLLYAIIEGASDALGISRSDINGCVDSSNLNPALILFDEAAGGAGHVKQISNKLDIVLRAALNRVSGKCGCGEETSCYGCLRSYSNQFDHDFISRGVAKHYLEWILLEGSSLGVTYSPISQEEFTLSPREQNVSEVLEKPVNPKWKEVLELLLGPNETKAYKLAMSLIENGVAAIPEIGYELSSEEHGVLGVEAEMAWPAQRIAVLLEDGYGMEEFQDAGWRVFILDQLQENELIEKLMN